MKNTIKLLSNVTEVISVYDTVIVMCNAIPKGKEKKKELSCDMAQFTIRFGVYHSLT